MTQQDSRYIAVEHKGLWLPTAKGMPKGLPWEDKFIAMDSGIGFLKEAQALHPCGSSLCHMSHKLSHVSTAFSGRAGLLFLLQLGSYNDRFGGFLGTD